MSGYTRYASLEGRPVYITGGGSGIGAAFVRAFLSNGARVSFCDIDASASAALADALAREGLEKPHFDVLDLRDIDALKRSIAAAEARAGAIRVLVNNAARDEREALDAITPESWDDSYAVNLRHHFFAAQAVRTGMAAAGGGAIINLSSNNATLGARNLAHYASAKGAVLALTRSLAREMGEENIRVNSIIPGWVMTERQIAKWLTPEAERQLMRDQCLKRRLSPNDVANLALFLASDDAAMITKQEFVVDGGWS